MIFFLALQSEIGEDTEKLSFSDNLCHKGAALKGTFLTMHAKGIEDGKWKMTSLRL